MKLYFIVSGEADIPKQELLKDLKKYGEVEIVKHKGLLSEVELLKKDKEEKILALDPKVFSWDLDVAALDKILKVKAICTSSTSFGWLKPEELKKRGILACNVPGFSGESVAEYAICMAIEVTRKLPILIKNGWKNDFKNMPALLKGKTAGVVGLGRIGTKMAELCQGIGMKVVYWSKNSKDKRFIYAELDELFKTSDVIFPALAENEETKRIITNKRIDLMKPSAVLVGINRVRSIWDENYVLEKVKKGDIWGYAMEGEGLKEPSGYEGNVWPVPPIAGYTKDAFENLLEIWVGNVKAVVMGKPRNVVSE